MPQPHEATALGLSILNPPPMIAGGVQVDSNGIQLVKWKSGLFDCFDSVIPNCKFLSLLLVYFQSI